VLGIVGAVVVLVFVAILLISLLGDSATDVVEKKLPAALEENFADQGVEVTVSKVECDEISDDDGPFTTSCEISIDGLAEKLDATVFGEIDGTTVRVNDVSSDQTILTADLAVSQTQLVVDEIDPTIGILSCTLDAPVVLVEEGMTFSCEADSDETVTFEVQDGMLVIIDVE